MQTARLTRTDYEYQEKSTKDRIKYFIYCVYKVLGELNRFIKTESWGWGKVVAFINQSVLDKSYNRHAMLSSITFWDVHSKRASGYLLASKCYIDNMWSFQYRSICAAENAVPSVFQYDLHRVPAPLWIHDDHTYITCARTWEATHHTFM